MQTKNIVILFTLLLMLGCATLTQDIKIKSSKINQINYDDYKTFRWAKNARIEFDPIGQWEQPTLETDKEVKLWIKKTLNERDLIETTEAADLIICFAAGYDFSTLDLTLHPEISKIKIKQIPASALLIAIIDAKTNNTIFIGYANGMVLKQQSIENIHKRIIYAVEKILKPFKRHWLYLPFMNNKNKETEKLKPIL